MKQRNFMAAMALMAASLGCMAAGFGGWWEMKVAGVPVVIHLEDNSGKLGGVLYSPSQTRDSIAVDVAEQRGDSLLLSVKRLRASFAGKRNGRSIDGVFTQGGVKFNTVMLPASALAKEKAKPQTPHEPLQYATEEVAIACGDSVTLAGTLTMPSNGRPVGALVFLSGSGAQDRDETVMGHKPFAVIADFLTKAGWATLRCDDRGVGGSKAPDIHASYAELAADALAQIDYLRSLPAMKGKPVGLLGHSQGGDIAFMAAADSPGQVDFIVAAAAPGIKGSDVVLKQNELIAGHFMNDAYRATLREMFALLSSDAPSSEIRSEVNRLAAQLAQPSAVEQLVDTSLSPSYRELLRHDPAPYMKRVKCPVLAINGDNDMQVTAPENLAAISAAIPQAVVKQYPGINHLMQPCDKPTLMYGDIDTTIAPQVMADILAFVLNL